MIPNWVRDYLLLPLFVGIVVATFTFVLPELFAEDLELSYELEGPVGIIDERVDETDIKILVRGKEAESVFGYMARLWNSGKKPITELPVRFQFGAPDAGFEILSVTHKTKPEVDFGAITEVEKTDNSRRVKYALLNPGDEDVVRFLSTRKTQLNVYAKAGGMLLVNRTKDNTGSFFDNPYVIAIGFIYVSALLAVAFRTLFVVSGLFKK